jgi:hypothetical protein
MSWPIKNYKVSNLFLAGNNLCLNIPGIQVIIFTTPCLCESIFYESPSTGNNKKHDAYTNRT